MRDTFEMGISHCFSPQKCLFSAISHYFLLISHSYFLVSLTPLFRLSYPSTFYYLLLLLQMDRLSASNMPYLLIFSLYLLILSCWHSIRSTGVHRPFHSSAEISPLECTVRRTPVERMLCSLNNGIKVQIKKVNVA